MIYLIATGKKQGERWLAAQGLEPSSAVVLTKEEDAQGRTVSSQDRVVTLPGADPGGLIFFYLSVHQSPQ